MHLRIEHDLDPKWKAEIYTAIIPMISNDVTLAMLRWLNRNYPNHIFDYKHNNINWYFVFVDKELAMEFKLKWG